MDERLTLEFDGGSRGNPGPAAIGVVIRAADNTPIFTLGRFIGRATNNVAEYRALITAMEKALELGAKKVVIRGDSELIIRQMTGVYKVRHPAMVPLYHEAQDLFRQFDEAKIQHNLRHHNELADKLANLAMDKKRDVTEDDGGASVTAVMGRGGEKETGSGDDERSAIAPKAGDRVACANCGCLIEIRTPSTLRPHQLKPFVCQCGTKMTNVSQRR